MDSFFNKRSEFLSKNQSDFNPVEYEIPGYNMFVNINPRRGVAIYTAKHLNAM